MNAKEVLTVVKTQGVLTDVSAQEVLTYVKVQEVLRDVKAQEVLTDVNTQRGHIPPIGITRWDNLSKHFHEVRFISGYILRVSPFQLFKAHFASCFYLPPPDQRSRATAAHLPLGGEALIGDCICICSTYRLWIWTHIVQNMWNYIPDFSDKSWPSVVYFLCIDGSREHTA